MRAPSIATVVLVSFAACKSASGPPATSTVLAHTDTWCPEGFEIGPKDTCFALPERRENAPILVYLHGMYEGHGSADEWAAVREATRRGFAVVLPRGKRGLCAWKAELRDHFCWPTEVEDPQPFKTIVAEWDRVLWQVGALLEGTTHKRYVLGFSNGGLFAEYLLSQGIFPAQGFAIVDGGALVPPAKTAAAPPVLLLAPQDDPNESAPSTKDKMRELHDGLAKAGWAHAWCTRSASGSGSGGGAALASSDVDAALRFFQRDADGSLKPHNGAYPCEGGAAATAATTAKKARPPGP